VAVQYGSTEPRIYTPPLRPLTPETSLGFEVVDFAREVLGVTLYPWQEWLLIHALELREDGRYRFRRIIVLVARQNGKTTLALVLTAWWLFVDSARRPDQVPPVKFKIVGTAQNLDIARGPWAELKTWCDPKPDTAEQAELAIPSLQNATAAVSDTNGKEAITARSRAHYEIRAAKNARGKPAARVLMDELREQKDWVAWNAVSQTTKSFWNGQLWGFSNAGAADAAVLIRQRNAGLKVVKLWEDYVEAGLMEAEEFANKHDVTVGLFEWSAPQDCEMDEVDGILAANPSIGYGAITVADCISDIEGMEEAGYRTEVLCQWVTADVETHIDSGDWALRGDPESQLADDTRMVVGIDTSGDRQMSYVAVAGWRDDGLIHADLVAQRPGMLWVVEYVDALCEKQGITEIALQTRGAPAAEFAAQLEKLGYTIVRIEGSALGAVAGQMKDHVRDKRIVHRAEEPVRLAVAGAVVRKLGEVKVWDRFSSPVDIAPLVAISEAVYGLTSVAAPAPRAPATPPPPAELITRDYVSPGEVNLALADF
jgi:phage terminase large subunit-like protein